jgi:hypothetical protein
VTYVNNAFSFSVLVVIPSGGTGHLRYHTSFWKSWNFSRLKTFRRAPLEQRKHFPHVKQLFLECAANHSHVIQVHETWLVSPLQMVSINCSNVAGALQRQKGMTVNCHNSWPIENSFLLVNRMQIYMPTTTFWVHLSLWCSVSLVHAEA